MARDVHDFKVPIKRTLYLNGSVSNNSVTNQQLTRSTRSDSVPTEPFPDGTYHKVTGYNAFFSRVSYNPNEVKWSTNLGNKYKYTWDGPEVPSSIWQAGCSGALIPATSNEVLSNVRRSMDSQVRDDLDISQFAGEARETAAFMANALRKLLKVVNAVRKLRKGDFGGAQKSWYYATIYDAKAASRSSKGAAQAYLAYMYGLRPLIAEVRKIAGHWDQRCEAPISKPLFAASEETFSLPETEFRKFTGKKLRGCSSGAYAYVLNPQLLRASQYGLTSPLSLIWELTTLSFVVDWFTGIGSFIQGLEPPLGVAIRDYWETRWVDCQGKWTIDYWGEFGKPGRLDGPHHKAEAGVRVKAMIRTHPSHLLPPPPYINLGVSSSQAVSILALIRARAG